MPRRQSLETVKLSFPVEVSNDLSWNTAFTSTLSTDPSFGKVRTRWTVLVPSKIVAGRYWTHDGAQTEIVQTNCRPWDHIVLPCCAGHCEGFCKPNPFIIPTFVRLQGWKRQEVEAAYRSSKGDYKTSSVKLQIHMPHQQDSLVGCDV